MKKIIMIVMVVSLFFISSCSNQEDFTKKLNTDITNLKNVEMFERNMYIENNISIANINGFIVYHGDLDTNNIFLIQWLPEDLELDESEINKISQYLSSVYGEDDINEHENKWNNGKIECSLYVYESKEDSPSLIPSNVIIGWYPHVE